MTAALWLGSAFFLMLAASAVFQVSPNASLAADVVGSLLARWHYIALCAPMVLFTLELRSARRLVLVALFVSLLFAASQALVDLRIREIRLNSPSPVSSLDPDHPVRRRFGILHGVSMMLLLAQGLGALVVVAATPQRASDTGTSM